MNEGLIEWPPSPWRILRALVSVGYTSGVWNGSGPDAISRGLIERLSSVLPTYLLPRGVGAHTRHYMPLAKLDKGKEATTLVFDTWARVEPGSELGVTWNVDLAADELERLGMLADRLGYLGRAESWVVARVARPGERVAGDNCFPCAERDSLRPGFEQVSLMATLDRDSYAGWRTSALDAALADLPAAPAGKKRLTASDRKAVAARERIAGQYPIDLIETLQTETSWLRANGWSQPPGSRRVLYWRPSDILEAGAPSPRPALRNAPLIDAMLLSLTSSSGNDGLLPHVSRTLPQADLLHRALVRVADASGHNSVLSGCDEDGAPRRDGHRHAHVLCLDLDQDQHLDHVLIWAPAGLDGSAQSAVRGVRYSWTKGGPRALRVAIAGAGQIPDLIRLPGSHGHQLRTVLAESKRWVSRTPFVPPRHLKKSGRNTLHGQVAAELEVRGIRTECEVRVLDPAVDEVASRHRHFVRRRTNGPQPPRDLGFTLEIAFAAPVRGPLCLGYGSHFGLGLFEASLPGDVT